MRTKGKKKSKSPQKQKATSSGTPTITSMFKPQSHQQKSTACQSYSEPVIQGPSSKGSNDSDVEITLIETESKYFGEKSPLKKSWRDAKVTGSLKGVTRRLSLKRAKSGIAKEQMNEKNEMSGKGMAGNDEVTEEAGTVEVTGEAGAVEVTGVAGSVEVTGREKERKGDFSVATSSQKENIGLISSYPAIPCEKISIRQQGKRKSSDTSEENDIDCKKLRKKSNYSASGSSIDFDVTHSDELPERKVVVKLVTHVSDDNSHSDSICPMENENDVKLFHEENEKLQKERPTEKCNYNVKVSRSGSKSCDTNAEEQSTRGCDVTKTVISAQKKAKHSKLTLKKKLCGNDDEIKMCEDNTICSAVLGTPREGKYLERDDRVESFVGSMKQIETGESNIQKVNETEDEEEVISTPYYLENFRTIISSVLNDKDNLNLYSEEDIAAITSFQHLTEEAQKLYIRLFGRKWMWLAVSRIKYPAIAEDLTPVIEELTVAGFFMTDSELSELEPTLNLLPAADLKSLAKIYHLNISLGKKELIPLLVKKSKQNTIGSMFKLAGHNAGNIMLNRAKKMLGGCLCLQEEPRKVFIQTLMLFSLTDTILDEDMTNGQTTQLFRMLQVNIGAAVYPPYKINKKTQIFSDRVSFRRFAEASMLEAELWSKLERNNWKAAYDVYTEAVNRLELLQRDSHIEKKDMELPVFLRPYTAVGVYMRVLNQGVEILQRRKDYTAAVSLLNKLLSQQTYCTDYRGHWWERLSLNYDAHLKNLGKALQAAECGLKDQHVRAGRRLALYQRAEKICTAPNSRFLTRLRKIPDMSVKEAPKIFVDGMVLSDNVPGQKYKFMIADREGGTDDITFCGVEQLAMEHYKQHGFTEGLHAEGSIVSNLFGIFFWDLIFSDVPDAFHSPYQTYPLDMYSQEFYNSRKAEIDKRIHLIKNSSLEDICEMSAKTWADNFSTLCVGVNWELFNSLQHLQGFLTCFGGENLAVMLERFAKDPRHTRSGFPDLTMWNPDQKALKISEVKGPGDRLSHKQILWLDYLIQNGIDAEVCHVKAVSSKRLVASATT